MQTIQQTIEQLINTNYLKEQTFIQAVNEVVHSIKPVLEANPKYQEHNIIQRLTTPDRTFKFKVVWLDDNENIQVNTGYRVQFNNTLGPYKGGLRFHPSVNLDILQFLGFEQIFKNALTGLPIGGAKGGSDFDPKGKSDMEVMKFCSAFISELYKYIGPRIDVPAGDIGVGSREIGYLFGKYKKLTSSFEGIFTGKPSSMGGSLIRPEATGYGCVYFTNEMYKNTNIGTLKDKVCIVSGSGNVAIHTIEKLYHMGAKPVSCSDSKGTIYDKDGIDLALLKALKISKRVSLDQYKKSKPEAIYTKVENYPQNSHAVWQIKADLAFACATQNELNEYDAKVLISNGIKSITEGANMPTTPEAIKLFQENNILFAPAKAANAGGVAVSSFEMSQNASMVRWSAKEVDSMLENTMKQIFDDVHQTAIKYSTKYNYIDGANIAGFVKVANSMIAEGI